MVDYVKLASTAKKLLDKSGRTVQIVVKGAAVNPAKPWDGHVDDGVTVPVFAVFVDYTRRDRALSKVQANDKRLIVPAEGLSVDILNAHKVLDGGVAYQVVEARKVQPAGVALIYELQVRS